MTLMVNDPSPTVEPNHSGARRKSDEAVAKAARKQFNERQQLQRKLMQSVLTFEGQAKQWENKPVVMVTPFPHQSHPTVIVPVIDPALQKWKELVKAFRVGLMRLCRRVFLFDRMYFTSLQTHMFDEMRDLCTFLENVQFEQELHILAMGGYDDVPQGDAQASEPQALNANYGAMTEPGAMTLLPTGASTSVQEVP